MNNECKKYKDKIIDFVSGLLEKSEIKNLQQHLEKCPECNDYANVLKSEDKLLTDFFTQVDSDTRSREQKVLNTINTPEQKETGSRMILRPFIKLAAAAAIMFIVLFGIDKFETGSIAWADVVEKFKSVKYFNASIYWKENIESEPVQIELWMSNDGKIRILFGQQVIFAENAKIIKAFDIESREEVNANMQADFFVNKFGSSREFSLETIISAISPGQLEDVTPMINPDAVISQDIVVFDTEISDFQWFRIWALKESKLPMRIKLWTPNDGSSLDIVFSYSKQQPEDFFNPDSFQTAMLDRNLSKVNLAYMFLEDHGQKKVSPAVADKHKAFEVVTQTLDGQPWSLADYQGKTVILYFWARYILWPDVHKQAYEIAKGQDDLIFAGVNLDPSADIAKEYCEKEGIDGLQLHENIKPWQDDRGGMFAQPDNKLAKAFGVTYPGQVQVVLIKKDGSISKIDKIGLVKLVEALNRNLLMCPSQEWWSNIITHQGKDNGHMTQEEIVQRFGKPHSIENRPFDNTVWKYEAFQEEMAEIVLLTILFFDKTGEIVGTGAQY
ncbi:MAG: redoxin domain-containing protein [Sedimentisphaerales bacterium]|nr:redoxin domain-containing protein [Sedimentisphaerales bacterium]